MGNFHGEEKEGEIFALKYRGRAVFVASVSRRLMTERRPMFLKQLSRCPVPIRVLLEMRDPSRVTSFSGRSTGSRNRKANRNDHLFRIRPLPSSSFIAQTASRASSLQSRDDQVRSFVDSWRGIATRVNRRAKNVYRG